MGCQWASSDSGEEVALRWGEGEVKKRGWAKLERFSAGRKAVEKKNNPPWVLLAPWCPFPETKNQKENPTQSF